MVPNAYFLENVRLSCNKVMWGRRAEAFVLPLTWANYAVPKYYMVEYMYLAEELVLGHFRREDHPYHENDCFRFQGILSYGLFCFAAAV